MKHKLTFFAVLMMALAIPHSLKAYDFSAVAPTGQTLYYNINGGTVTVTYPTAIYNAGMLQGSWNGYTKPVGYLTIPSTVEHGGITYSVTAIDERAFASCTGLISVTIPNSIISIGALAFSYVNNIIYDGNAEGNPWGAKTVNGYLEDGFVFSNSTKNVLTGYYGTNTTVTIPNTVTSIGDAAFRGINNITLITIPNSVISIGNTSFYGCSGLTSVSIPNSVTSIGSQSFYQCSGLSSITIPESVTNIGNIAFGFCTGLNTIVFNATNCTTMGASMYSCAFYRCNNISTVLFGENVQTIPNYAFYGCSSISSVTMNDSVTHIGVCAFANCTGIASLSVPNSVTSIGYDAFFEIRNVSYHGTASGSPWGAYCINAYYEGDFMYSDVSKTVLMGYTGSDTSVTIPNTVISIGENAFRNSNITSISIPSSVTIIGDDAFRQSNLRNISLPNALNAIGNRAFMQCTQLTSINIPNSVYSIGNSAFSYCTALETAYISSPITTLGSETFSNCTNIRFVSLPQYLQSIGDGAFNNCYKLTDLNVPTSVTQIGTNAFGYVRNIIYNGSASEDCYMDLCYWGARCKNGYFHDSVYYADATMHSLMSVHPLAKNITIHNTTQSVANFAFYHCDVQSITYPSSVTSLGDQLYDGSTELRHIYCESTTPPSMSSWYDPLEFNYDSVTVHVPCGSLLNYTGSWHCFSHFIEAEAEYTIGISSNNVNAGTATILLSPSCSSNEVVIIAQPNDGFFFSMWNDSVTSNPRYLVLENDLNLVAIFTSTPPAPDTVHVHDTTYVPVHDTTVVSIHDTTYVSVHDTTYITLTDTVTNTIYDTVTNTVFDTITNTVFDTVINTIYDTTVVYSTDTLWLHDTVFVHDTIYIYDTIYVGVVDVETISAKIYTSNGQIVVDGSQGNTVWLYDVNGRVLATKQDEFTPLHFDVPSSGAYLVKIGNHPARKVVVIR